MTEKAPPPAATADAAEPVFVDRSGRRGRLARRLAGLAGFAFVTYLVLLGATFARAPWVPRIVLPVLGNGLPRPASAPPALGAAAIEQPTPSLPALTGQNPTRTAPKRVASPAPSPSASLGGAVKASSTPTSITTPAPPPSANASTPPGAGATPQASPTPTGAVTASVTPGPSKRPTVHPSPRP